MTIPLAAPTLDTAPSDPAEELKDQRAFEATAVTRAALDVSMLPRYVLDAMYASGKALVACAATEPYRHRLVLLADFDIVHLDDLEGLARALRYVQVVIRGRIAAQSKVPELATEGFELRGLMVDYAVPLERKKILQPGFVARIREGSGYLDLIEDLRVLANELRALSEILVGDETVVTRADLRRADELAQQLHLLVATGPTGDLSLTQLQVERRKLGSLLVTAHTEVHDAMAWLRRREGDVAQLVPSLYVPAGARKHEDPEAPPTLASLHEQLHQPEAPPLRPEDNPFAHQD